MRLDYMKYALNNVLHRRMRSWLTVLSILIGISAIYALVSFGQGLSAYVNDFSSKIGTDKLILQAKSGGAPGTDENFYISKDDIDYLRKINGIDEIAGLYFKSVEVKYKDSRIYSFIISMPTGPERRMVEESFTIDVVNGRDLRAGDKYNIVLGYNYQFADKIFPKPVKLRDKITINGIDFNVVGFYDEIGDPPDDSQTYITNEAFEEIFPETKDKYQYGIARTDPTVDASALAEKATEKLRKHKGLKEGQEDFFIQSFDEAIATFTTILDVINAVLVLIALISLVVAGVNITNTMYTAVLERTKEIGIMKSIGAKNFDIMFIFLFESATLGLVGGILGVIFGFIVASIGGSIAAASGYALLKPFFPWWLTVGCILFAVFIAAGAGFLPSRQASKLNPVDALRYE